MWELLRTYQDPSIDTYKYKDSGTHELTSLLLANIYRIDILEHYSNQFFSICIEIGQKNILIFFWRYRNKFPASDSMQTERVQIYTWVDEGLINLILFFLFSPFKNLYSQLIIITDYHF